MPEQPTDQRPPGGPSPDRERRPTERSTRGVSLTALLRSMRPRQWVKNLLVVAAPLASGRLFQIDVLQAAAVAFLAFCAASAAMYLLNDLRDVDEDRAHPDKRHRPLAAGLVSPAVALTAAVVLAAAALAIAAAATPALVLVVGIYLVAASAYTLALKDQPVLDLAIVAAGFLLRATAGGVAAGLELSQWFLLSAAFGSLFVVAGKRYSELILVGEGTSATRRSLGRYSLSYLRFVWTLSATVTVMTYGLWAFEMAATFSRPVLVQLSIGPFVLGMLRYTVNVDRGDAGEPELIAITDRVLQVLVAVWLVLFMVGVTNG